MSSFNQKEYINNYRKTHYRSIQLHMPFEDANKLDDHIKTTGEKRMVFIKRAIKETVEHETGEPFEVATKS